MCNVETGKIDFLSAHTLNRKFLEYKRQQRGLYVYYVTGIKCVRHIKSTHRVRIVCGKLSNCSDKKVFRATFRGK